MGMTVYTNHQAEADLDTVLEEATAHGEVRIRREDGSEFVIRPVTLPPHRHVQQLCVERQRDLSDLAGTWVEDSAFDDIMAAQRQIDPELWK